MAQSTQSPAHGHGSGAHSNGAHGHIGVRTYLFTFTGLLVLMIATVGAWWVEKNLIVIPEWLGVTIAMAIAGAKTALIIYYFMHVKISSRLVQIFASLAFVFLAILFIITMGDYIARGWPPQEGPLP
jgi:cytochrome c oxidase subunit IV